MNTLTFKCNYAKADLNKFFKEYGFRDPKEGESIDFSLWDTYKNKPIDSKIILNDYKYIFNLDSKRQLYNNIEKLKLLQYIPKTFPYVSELTDDMLDDNKIYFLKLISGSGGKDVHAIKSMKEIYTIISKKQPEHKKNINNYLLQEEVPNMYLHNGYKTGMRNYILVCDTGIYFYKEGYIHIYEKIYNNKELDNSVHNDLFNCKYENLSNQSYYKIILPQLYHICSELLTPYFKNISFNNKYFILGIDFIIDTDYKPYLIEINGHPNLAFDCGLLSVKKDMLNDFIKFYVLPKLTNKKPEIGGWVKI
jgi:hypothetical protein